jgi:signal peptidase I
VIWISIGVIIGACWFLVRTFVFGAYSVPTMAMEKTIHHGGKVLVNKLNYRPIKTGDILVFHFPVGDTVIDLPEYQSMRPYYDVIRELGRGNADSGRQIVLSNPNDYPLAIRPVYKREVYLKRCIATAGDTLEMRDEVLYINGRPQDWPPESETYFHVVTNGQPLDGANIKAQYGLDITNADEVRPLDNRTDFDMLLTWKTRNKMLKDGFAQKISLDIDSSADEGNKLNMRDGKIYINDREETSYTFKMDYYWVIGDNLHGSQDSRYWGFVPEDHLIGKVSVIL